MFAIVMTSKVRSHHTSRFTYQSGLGNILTPSCYPRVNWHIDVIRAASISNGAAAWYLTITLGLGYSAFFVMNRFVSRLRLNNSIVWLKCMLKSCRRKTLHGFYNKSAIMRRFEQPDRVPERSLIANGLVTSFICNGFIRHHLVSSLSLLNRSRVCCISGALLYIFDVYTTEVSNCTCYRYTHELLIFTVLTGLRTYEAMLTGG